MSIELGDKVKDKITGAIGIATAKTEYLYGCIRIAVQPLKIKDGTPVEGHWFDEPQLILISKARTPNKLQPGGGSNPPPMKDPQ